VTLPLPTLVRTLVEKKVEKFCDKRVPPHVRDKVRLAYKIRGTSVTIYEERAPWKPELTEWTSLPVAQMRYDAKTGKWTLYCADRNDRWHKYPELLATKNIDAILNEIDSDPIRIFWG